MSDHDPTTDQTFDAGRQRLGAVYAKALLNAAGDQIDLIMEELDSFVDDVLANTPKLQAALDSPRLSQAEKGAILDKAFQDKMNGTLLRFVKVVAGHDRADCFPEIRAAARQMYNDRTGRVEVLVQTAHPLDDAMAETIRSQLSSNLGREVVVHHQIDPSLIGGMVVRVGDTLYDGSVRNRLERLRDVTLEHTTQTIRNSLQRFAE